MRLFIAIQLDDKQREQALKTVTQLSPFIQQANIVDHRNYHITLHFLGEVNADRLIYIYSAMDSLKDMQAPQISMSHIVHMKNNSMVWIRIKGDERLTQLHNKLAIQLENAGFLTENRTYRPHISLAFKAKFNTPFSEATKCVDVYNKQFDANNIVLYCTQQDGSYLPIYTVKLQ